MASALAFNSAANGSIIAAIIPPTVQVRITQWAHSRMTGQISLNFNQGRVLSYDTKEHGVVPGRCNKCMAEREADDHRWVIIRGEALCGKCSPL